MLTVRITATLLSLFVWLGSSACSNLGPVAEHWIWLGLDAKWVTALAHTDWGLFAGTRSNGVFRYNSELDEWVPLGLESSRVRSMLFLPGDGPRLLVGVTGPTESAVYATEDAGETWIPWDGGLADHQGGYFSAHSLAADPDRPQRLYMGGSYSILRSDDGGQTWDFVHGSFESWGQGIQAIAVSPHSDGGVWAAGQSALGVGPIFRSLDSGDTWEVSFPAPYSEVVDGGAVIVSNDRGETWEPSLSEEVQVPALAYADGTLYAVAREFVEFDPTLGDPYYTLRLFRLRDGSDNWESIPSPGAWGYSP
jgi:photosystem II stability/assembly factor-like uncharacterized protein